VTTASPGTEQVLSTDFRVVFQQCRQFLNECLVNHWLGLALNMALFLPEVMFHGSSVANSWQGSANRTPRAHAPPYRARS